MEKWSGKRVVVVGAARQGIALARYLVRHGAEVIINDQLPEAELRKAREELANEPVTWVLGGHPVSLLDRADHICVSGGVPLTLPLFEEARRRGVHLTNDSEMFLEAAPCPVVGITGSAGKTTTTTLFGRMTNALPNRVWVGGNIGTPLISYVDGMEPSDLAVMELSSFQLELMTVSPRIAAVLNLTPNHLDRHGTMEAYRAAKARILDFQTHEDVAVLNRDDPGSWSLAELVRGELVSFGLRKPDDDQVGVYLSSDGESILIHGKSEGHDEVLLERKEISLRGDHNLANVLAACALAWATGLPPMAISAGVKGFYGLPHRLEFVRNWGGADWYNDSIATAPERAIAAVRSFDEPLILLAGGRDKNLDWDSFAALVHQRVKHLILFGEATEKIARAVNESPVKSQIELAHCATLLEAVQTAARTVAPGEVVLLSPGGTSFDEFRDFEDRGEAYKKWVMALP